MVKRGVDTEVERKKKELCKAENADRMKDRAKIQSFRDEIKARGKARHNMIPGEVAYERGLAHL